MFKNPADPRSKISGFRSLLRMLLEQVLTELCVEDVDVEESIELSIEDVEIQENPEPCIEDTYIEENEDPIEVAEELLPFSRCRVPAAVPFLWEEIPGKPKRNFKNDPSPLSDPPHIKAAAAASVPFKWEEKPGLPKVLSKQSSYLALSLPPHRQKFPLSHMAAAAAATNSAKGQPSRLKGIFPTRLMEFIKPSPPPKYTEKSQENEAQELVLSPCRGSDGDDEMFELDLSAFAFNGVKEPHSSRREAVSESLGFKSSELRSSSKGGRSSDSAPALLANCLLTMMEMSQAVPVEDSFERNMALPLLVSVNGSKDGGDADHKTHRNNSSEYHLECQRFDSIQPASPHRRETSPHGETSPIVAWNESDSLGSIRWGERDLVSSDEVRRTSPIDTPCLELGIASEEKSQVKGNDMNGYDSCSSPMGSTFVFVAGGTSGSSTPLPSDIKTSASSVQELNSNSGLVAVPSGTGPDQSGSSSESNDCFAKDIGPPGNDSGSSSESNDLFAKDIGPPGNDSRSSSESNDCFAKDFGHPGNDSGSSPESNASSAKTIGHPVNDPSHFQQGSSLDAGMEETVPAVFDANFQKHSRKPSFSARKLALCMEKKMSKMSCCSPGPIHTVYCCRGGIPTAHTISCFKAGDNHTPNCFKAGDNHIPNCSILSCQGGKWLKHENPENSYATSDRMGQYRPPRPHSE